MIQLSVNMIFLILLFSIMGKIIYDYLKSHKLKYASYGIAFVSWLIVFALLKFVFELKKTFTQIECFPNYDSINYNFNSNNSTSKLDQLGLSKYYINS